MKWVQNMTMTKVNIFEAKARTKPRPVGGAKGLKIPDAFFESLPDDFIDGFYRELSPRARLNTKCF